MDNALEETKRWLGEWSGSAYSQILTGKLLQMQRGLTGIVRWCAIVTNSGWVKSDKGTVVITQRLVKRREAEIAEQAV